jgi:hypothetical protein
VNEEIGKTDNPKIREQARKIIRLENERVERLKRRHEWLRELGYTPEYIKRSDENITKRTIISGVAFFLGAVSVAGYGAYRVLRWAWRTFWVTDENPDLAEWKETNDNRKY